MEDSKMNKRYIVPEMEIIQLEASQSMLLPVSGKSTDSQWAPEIDIDEIEE